MTQQPMDEPFLDTLFGSLDLIPDPPPRKVNGTEVEVADVSEAFFHVFEADTAPPDLSVKNLAPDLSAVPVAKAVQRTPTPEEHSRAEYARFTESRKVADRLKLAEGMAAYAKK